MPSRALRLGHPRSRTNHSGIDGLDRIGGSDPIGQTVIGPRRVIKKAQDDIGGDRQTDHEQKAGDALEGDRRRIPVHGPPPAGDIVEPSTYDYPCTGG
jgi:hypothetical protein